MGQVVRWCLAFDLGGNANQCSLLTNRVCVSHSPKKGGGGGRLAPIRLKNLPAVLTSQMRHAAKRLCHLFS